MGDVTTGKLIKDLWDSVLKDCKNDVGLQDLFECEVLNVTNWVKLLAQSFIEVLMSKSLVSLGGYFTNIVYNVCMWFSSLYKLLISQFKEISVITLLIALVNSPANDFLLFFIEMILLLIYSNTYTSGKSYFIGLLLTWWLFIIIKNALK